MKTLNQEIKDQKIMGEILACAEFIRISMIDGDRPYILPFNYGYKDGCIYIPSAPEGKKIDLLKQNPEVCFEIEQSESIIKSKKSCKWSSLYRSVEGSGTVEIVSDREGKQSGMEIIMAQHGAPDPDDFNPQNMKYMVILKLNIASLSGKQSHN